MFLFPESTTPLVAGLVVTVVVIAVLVIEATVFGVKYFKLKQTQSEHELEELYHENQAAENSPQVQSSASPQDERLHSDHKNGNTGKLHGHSDVMKSSTDNIPCENPDDLNGCTDNTPYENPDEMNLHHPTDNSPRENSGDVNVKRSTDNSPYENPEAMTSEYLTISEAGTTTENSHALTGQYENVNRRGNQYEAIHMSGISATVNPYEAIRH